MCLWVGGAGASCAAGSHGAAHVSPCLGLSLPSHGRLAPAPAQTHIPFGPGLPHPHCHPRHTCTHTTAAPPPSLRLPSLATPEPLSPNPLDPVQIIETTGAALEGRRILMYSYGSGISATMFSLVGRHVEGRFNLARMQAMVREGGVGVVW